MMEAEAGPGERPHGTGASPQLRAGRGSPSAPDGCLFTSRPLHPKIYSCMCQNHKKQYKLLMADKVDRYSREPVAQKVTSSLISEAKCISRVLRNRFGHCGNLLNGLGCWVKNKSGLMHVSLTHFADEGNGRSLMASAVSSHTTNGSVWFWD